MLRKLLCPKHWSVHNPLKGWVLHGLSTHEVQLLLQTVSVAERRLISVWNKGWATWRPLEDDSCVGLLRAPPVAEFSGPPPPAGHRDDEVTDVQIASSGSRRDSGREHDRRYAKVDAEILQGAQTFRTHTVDISEGGMRFGDVLPGWVAGYFTVILYQPNGKPFEITCMLVEDQKKEKVRVEVVETNDEESHLPAFRAWVQTLPRS